MLTSRVGMSKKSSDPVTDGLIQRFTIIEEHVNKLVKDSTAFRDAVNTLMSSSVEFAHAFSTTFSPIGGESMYEFEGKFPQAKTTIQHIGTYSAVFDELKETIRPEIELMESRVLAPTKEVLEFVKKIRKTITKREHKLVDYDRHNNTYSKLREKKEKSLADEKNMFKVEQDYEAASSEYEHFNGLLQSELPRFFDMVATFLSPLWETFYFIQLNVYYCILEKLNGFATEANFNLNAGDVEAIYAQKVGDAGSQMAALTISKRGLSTAHLMSMQRSSGSGSPARASSISSGSRFTPPVRTDAAGHDKAAEAASSAAPRIHAPPPYSRTTSTSSQTSLSGKRAPPPPPALKPRPSYVAKPIFATAQYDFQAQNEGDLSFQVGDRIEILKKNEDQWWQGKLNGLTGVFPANYVQEE